MAGGSNNKIIRVLTDSKLYNVTEVPAINKIGNFKRKL
jgi:hypothetical protein